MNMCYNRSCAAGPEVVFDRGAPSLSGTRTDGSAHNLLRAAATLAGAQHAAARGATLRRRIVNIPARLARPQRKPILHLPSRWPWADAWLALWRNTIGYLHRQRT